MFIDKKTHGIIFWTFSKNPSLLQRCPTKKPSKINKLLETVVLMKVEKVEEGKWILHDRIRIKLSFDIMFRKTAPTVWVIIFIIFGPLQVLLHNDSYKGAVIFGNDPFAYFMIQGLFVATFTIGVMYLIDWIVKRRKRTKSMNELHST